MDFYGASNFVPKKKFYGIGIFNKMYPLPILDLKKSNNWTGISKYFFDDCWPKEWKEYKWINRTDNYFGGLCPEGWEKIKNLFDERKENFLNFLETQGHLKNKGRLFDEYLARDILKNFEKFGKEAEGVLIHCTKGKTLSPAIAIAMNEIYGWKIKGLKEKFPHYRRFVYGIMMDASKNL